MAKISLNQKNLKDILDAFDHYFPSGTIYSADKPFTSFSGEYHWNNRATFVDFVYRLTGVVIKSEKDLAGIKEAQQKLVDLVSEPKPEEKPEANIPDKDARELQEAERLKREQEIKEIKEKTQNEVRKSIEKKQEIYTKQKELGEKIQESLKGKKIIVTPEERFTKVTLTPEEKNKLFNLAQAVKTDRQATQQIIEQKIGEAVQKSSEDIKQNVDNSIINLVAVDLTEKMASFSNFTKPEDIPTNIYTTNHISPIVAITDFDNPLLINAIPDNATRFALTQNAKAVAISLSSDAIVKAALIEPLFENSKNISQLFYSKEITKYQIAQNQNDQTTRDEGMEVDLSSVYDQGKKTFDLWQKTSNKNITVKEILSATTTNTSTYTTTGLSFSNNVLSFTSKAISVNVGAVAGLRSTNTLASGLVSKNALAISSQSISKMVVGGGAIALLGTAAPFLGIVTQKVGFIIPTAKIAVFVGKGVAVGGRGMLAAGFNFGKSALAVGLSSKGLALAATGIFAKTIGFLTGPVGIVLSIIASFIPWDKVFKFIKKHAATIMGLVTGLIVAPFTSVLVGTITGAVVYVVSSIAIGAGGLIAGGAGVLGAIGASVVGLIATMGGGFLAIFGKPFLTIVLVFPITVAIMLLIINSGAYVVPPTNMSLLGNPYIEITKQPEPAGPFENSELPITINYTVTITAKKGVLINIRFEDICQVITAAGTNQCPSHTPTDVPDQISPSAPYVFTYSSTYAGSNYIDSLVVNTFTVIADVVDKGEQKVAASASIVIGDPPIDCPNNAWPIIGNGGLNDITQGPSAPGCTHANLNNAIDIGVSGEPIIAMHNGIATVGTDPCVGKYVKIASSCGSSAFTSLYGHLGSVSVKNGQTVALGQVLGITDNTGTCTDGPHLHFSFITSSIPIVQKPYLIRDIPVGCCSRTTCNP